MNNQQTDLQVAEDLERLCDVVNQSINKAQSFYEKAQSIDEIKTLIKEVENTRNSLLEVEGNLNNKQQEIKNLENSVDQSLYDAHQFLGELETLKDLPLKFAELEINQSFLTRIQNYLDELKNFKEFFNISREEIQSVATQVSSHLSKVEEKINAADSKSSETLSLVISRLDKKSDEIEIQLQDELSKILTQIEQSSLATQEQLAGALSNIGHELQEAKKNSDSIKQQETKFQNLFSQNTQELGNKKQEIIDEFEKHNIIYKQYIESRTKLIDKHEKIVNEFNSILDSVGGNEAIVSLMNQMHVAKIKLDDANNNLNSIHSFEQIQSVTSHVNSQLKDIEEKIKEINIKSTGSLNLLISSLEKKSTEIRDQLQVELLEALAQIQQSSDASQSQSSTVLSEIRHKFLETRNLTHTITGQLQDELSKALAQIGQSSNASQSQSSTVLLEIKREFVEVQRLAQNIDQQKLEFQELISQHAQEFTSNRQEINTLFEKHRALSNSYIKNCSELIDKHERILSKFNSVLNSIGGDEAILSLIKSIEIAKAQLDYANKNLASIPSIEQMQNVALQVGSHLKEIEERTKASDANHNRNLNLHISSLEKKWTEIRNQLQDELSKALDQVEQKSHDFQSQSSIVLSEVEYNLLEAQKLSQKIENQKLEFQNLYSQKSQEFNSKKQELVSTFEKQNTIENQHIENSAKLIDKHEKIMAEFNSMLDSIGGNEAITSLMNQIQVARVQLDDANHKLTSIRSFESYFQEFRYTKNHKYLRQMLWREFGFAGMIVYLLRLLTPHKK